MMGHREATKGGAEYDCITGWRHVLCSFYNSNKAHQIKHQMSRRNRRQHRQRLKEMECVE